MKKIISAILASVMLISINIPLSPVAPLFSLQASAVDNVIAACAPQGTRDIAVDAAVTSSYYYESSDGMWSLSNINDGLPGSYANGGYTSPGTETQEVPAWLLFDLEGYYDISRISFFAYGSFPDTFDVSVSIDGKNYTTVASESGRAGNCQTLSLDTDCEAVRFVKINITRRGVLDGNPIYYIQFGEIAIYGSSVSPANTASSVISFAPVNCLNLAADAVVTANDCKESGSDDDYKWSKANLNDELVTGKGYTTLTAASATERTPVDIIYDFGYTAQIKRAVIFPFGIFPSDFELQLSSDGETYTTAASYTNMAAGQAAPFIMDLSGFQYARFVRLHITKRNCSSIEPFYVQFGEFAVYGIKNAVKVSLNKSSLDMKTSDSEALTACVKFKDFDTGESNFVWSSADGSIASITDSGVVTAESPGSTVIYYDETNRGFRHKIPVKVSDSPGTLMDSFVIGVYNPPLGNLMTDSSYKLLSEAGINLALNPFNVQSLEENRKLIETADKYGVKTLVGDSRLAEYSSDTGMTDEAVEAVIDDYSSISGMAGFYLKDEPENPNPYASIYNQLKAASPRSHVHMNFLPGYVYDSYEQYEYQFDDWAVLTDNTDYLMFDIYPFTISGGVQYDYMFNSLNSMRKSGLKHGVNTAAYIQTVGYGPASMTEFVKRIPTETDIRYQDLVSVAYGAKQLAYFTCVSSVGGKSERFSTGLIDTEGNPTERYEYVKKIDNELQRLDRAVNLTNLDAKEVYLTGSETYGQAMIPSGFFVQCSTSASTVFSYMADRSTNKNYLMIVNNDLTNTVTLPLNFASGITSLSTFHMSSGTWTNSAVSGTYSVTIPAGDAVFLALPDGYDYGATPIADTENTALHAVVTGDSSIGESGWYFSCLSDGYLSSNADKGLNGWCSALADASYETSVQLDLQKSKTINSVTLSAADIDGYSGYFPKSYTVSVSDNASSWTQVASEANAAVIGSITYDFDAVLARYIKIDITEMNAVGGKYAAALCEVSAGSSTATKAVRSLTVPDGTSGYWVYSYCLNATSVKYPTWTKNNGNDDIIWHIATQGSWNINGKSYNYRCYISVSDHNNELGNYITHIYTFGENVTLSSAIEYDFATKLIFDNNIDHVSKNLISDLSTYPSGSGLTVSCNQSDDSLTFDGTLNSNLMLLTSEKLDTELKKGDKIRFTVEKLSGSAQNIILVLDLTDSCGGEPNGTRLFRNVNLGGAAAEIPIDSDSLAQAIGRYCVWIYYSGASVVQSASSCKVRLKLEVVKSDYAYSQSSRTVYYGSAYGELPTLTSDDGTFDGWFTEPLCGTQVTAATTAQTIGTQVLYAHWRDHKYHITFDNMFDGKKWESDTVGLASCIDGSTVSGITSNGFTLTENGTTSDVYTKYVGAEKYGTNFYLIPVQPDTNYILFFSSTCSDSSELTQVYVFGLNENAVSFANGSGWIQASAQRSVGSTTLDFTTTGDCKYIQLRFGTRSASGPNTVVFSDILLRPTDSAVPTGYAFDGRDVVCGSTYGELPTPTREGCTFEGWRTAPGGSGAEVTSSSTVTLTQDTALWSSWSINSYVFTIDIDGVKTVTSFNYGAAITKPENPTKEGYTFAGWSSAIPDKMPANDVTVTAQWDAILYTVTFNVNGITTAKRATTGTLLNELYGDIGDITFWYTTGDYYMNQVTAIAYSDMKVSAAFDGPQAPWSIRITNAQDISVGGTVRLGIEATAPYNAVTGSIVSWKSGNERIAVVDSDGVVTGVAGGMVKITVTDEYGNSAYCSITVNSPEPRIRIFSYSGSTSVKLSWWESYSDAKMDMGYSAVNCNSAVHYVWSSNSRRVRIDQSGRITNTGYFSRSATITLTAYDSDNNIVAESSITVKFFKFDWQKHKLENQSIVSDNVFMQNLDESRLNSIELKRNQNPVAERFYNLFDFISCIFSYFGLFKSF